jgi:hypothetical protein
VMDRCRTDVPVLQPKGHGRHVACWLHEEPAASDSPVVAGPR